MNWQPAGFQSARLVDETGLILADVEYRVGANEVLATLRNPFRILGAYVTKEQAQAACEKALSAPSPAAAPGAKP